MFENVDLEDFWDDSEYAENEYLSEDVTDEVVKSIEKELGYVSEVVSEYSDDFWD